VSCGAGKRDKKRVTEKRGGALAVCLV